MEPYLATVYFRFGMLFSERELPPLLYDKVKDVDGGKDDSLSLYKMKLQFPFAVQSNVESLEASYDKFATQNDLFRAVSGEEQPLITDISGQIQNGQRHWRSEKIRRYCTFMERIREKPGDNFMSMVHRLKFRLRITMKMNSIQAISVTDWSASAHLKMKQSRFSLRQMQP